jgi:ribonucleoside-diphosphate reductase alpha chain
VNTKLAEIIARVDTPERIAKLNEVHEIGRQIPAAPDDLPEPTFSENAWYIGRTRYAKRDENGEPIESPKQMLWRIAYNISAAERLYSSQGEEDHLLVARKFYDLMAKQEYIANTPTMLNAGRPSQQLSACFVLPVEDSLDGILQTAIDMAKIHKSGGGTGFSFSRLRPKGDVIASSGGTTTGPVAFMQTYNDVTGSVKQGGVRRGANMGILHYTHPDILLFITYKVEEFSLTNFNISVSVDEAFFEAAERDAKFLTENYEDELDFEGLVTEIRAALSCRDMDLKVVLLDAAVAKLQAWCEETDSERGYALINPRDGREMGRLNAKKVLDLITRLAWQYGDPGMIMIDRINESRANPTPQLGRIESTNPCGEQPLLPYDACTLGSINLSKFVIDDDLDWDRLRKAVHISLRFLDDVLDMTEYPVDKIHGTTQSIRRIGLGIMGFADALLAMRIGYNTQEGLDVAERVMKFVQTEADRASVELARQRGVFPAFEGSIYDRPGEIRPRNGARTTIAPTGTIAMLADCSSGCEPLFALTYAKNTIEGKRLFQTSPYFLDELKRRGLYSEELLEKIQENGGSVQGMAEIPEDVQRVFVVAGDITPEWHLRVQAAFQKYVDNAISKTINFPNSATVQDVRNAYWMSYKLNCKGITIYRDGSREKQILETKKESSYFDKLAGKEAPEQNGEIDAPEEAATESSAPITLKPRPEALSGRTYRIATPMGSAFISVNEDDDGNIFEVFIHLGNAGSDTMADAEAMGRLISLAFRIPSDYSSSRIAQNVVDQLSGIGGSSAAGFGAKRVRSLAGAVARAITEHEAAKAERLAARQAAGVDLITVDEIGEVEELVVIADPAPVIARKSTVDLCPECGNATLRRLEGCQKCELCGYSKC